MSPQQMLLNQFCYGLHTTTCALYGPQEKIQFTVKKSVCM
jgi:hypothetical protein